MKSLTVILLLACATLGWAQSSPVSREIKVKPVVETTSLDSIVFYPATLTVRNGQHRTAVTVIDSFHTTQGSAVVRYRGKNPTPAAAVASIAALQNVGGTSGINGGSYLVSVATGDTLWTLSDTCTNTGAAGLVNSDTLSFWAPAARFTSVAAGQRIVGTGFRFGTTVGAVSADSNGFTINQYPTAYGRQSTMRFGYFTSAAYGASSDAMGFPFVVTDTLGNKRDFRFLQTVILVDSSKQAAACELVLFDSLFTATTDNAAFGPSDDDASHIVAIIPISTWYTYADNAIAVEPNLGIAIKKTPLYGQLVSKGTPTFLSSTPLTLKLIFVTE